MTDVPQDAPRSEDGQWWWDGTQWQAVPAGGSTAGPAAAQDPGTPGGAGSGATVDLSQYPTLKAFAESGSVDGWLQQMGVDPGTLTTDDSQAST